MDFTYIGFRALVAKAWLASHSHPAAKSLYWLSYSDSSDKQPDDTAWNSGGGAVYSLCERTSQPHSTAAEESLLPSYTILSSWHENLSAESGQVLTLFANPLHRTCEVSVSHTGVLGRSGVPGRDAISFGENDTLHWLRDIRIWRDYFCRNVGNHSPPPQDTASHPNKRIVSSATPLWEPEISFMSIPAISIWSVLILFSHPCLGLRFTFHSKCLVSRAFHVSTISSCFI